MKFAWFLWIQKENYTLPVADFKIAIAKFLYDISNNHLPTGIEAKYS